MRDDTDTVTAELPGVEPPPPIPFEKRPQAERRTLMQLQGPRERPRCENCRYASLVVHEEDTAFERETLRCSVGDFPVRRGAICKEWTADKA